MMQGMLAAVAGLKAHEAMLNVVADNIANVNTTGFKSSRTSFEDAFAQTLRAASAPVGGATPTGIGGTNATQIGLGVQLGGTETDMTEGSIQSTGKPLDLAVQGNGWFAVTNDPAVSNASWAFTRAGDFQTDSNGNLVTQNGQYVVGFKVNSGTGALTTTPGTPGLINIPTTAQSVSVDSTGMVTAIDSTGAQFYCGQLALQTFANEEGLTRQSGNTYVSSTNAGPNGAVAGTPNGVLSTPTTGGTGSLVPGALEMSNVDLAAEFTNMITAERGFQANSRAITTSDEMLQELVNIVK